MTFTPKLACRKRSQLASILNMPATITRISKAGNDCTAMNELVEHRSWVTATE